MRERGKPAVPGRLPAAALALLVHLLFIGLLIYSVSWKSHPPAPVMADLWASLPAPPEKFVPKPVPRPAPLPTPKLVVEKPAPELPKPDIALKQKEKKLREQQQREADVQRKEVAQRKENEVAQQKQAVEQARKQVELQQQKLAAAAKQTEQKKQDELKRKQDALRKLNDQQMRDAMNRELASESSQLRQAAQSRQSAAGQSKMEAEYQDRIRAKIKSRLRLPETMTGNPKVIYLVNVLPSGEVVQPIKLLQSSGQPAYDAAVERAILQAVPLPLPPDQAVAARFRELKLPIQPKQEN
jgi:colicin import membrane protein